MTHHKQFDFARAIVVALIFILAGCNPGMCAEACKESGKRMVRSDGGKCECGE